MENLINILMAVPLVKWVIEPFLVNNSPSITMKKDNGDNLKTLVKAEEALFIKEIKDLEFADDKPLKVEISDSGFDISKIKEYEGEEIKKFEFRPQTFNEFIGQASAKEEAKTIIKLAQRGIKSHFIVNGIRGHGKTTYVELIAKELNAKIIERIGKQVDEKNLVDIVNEINNSKEKYVILFIDEIDTLDWKVIKVLNPIIESFKIGGKKIKPFIFASATINKHILIDKTPDTMDRIPNHIKFEKYNAEEIGKIIKQYKEQLYPNDLVPLEIIKIISENCKFNPRTSISLLSKFVVEQDIKKVLSSSKIVKEGLNTTDIAILRALNEATRAVGANALAMRVGLSQKEYIAEYEPFLCEYNFLNRVPSRIITDKGKKILEEIEKGIE